MNIDDRDARQPVAATESTVGRQCRLGGGTELACRIDAIETIPALPAGYRVLVHHWIAVWECGQELFVESCPVMYMLLEDNVSNMHPL